MRNRSTLVFAALAAAIVLAALVGAASAHRLAMSSQSFRATWTEFRFIETGTRVIRCKLTLEGSFHSRTLSKVLEQLIGYVTRATTETCTGGSVEFLPSTLPWHVRYDGFSGTLPRITEIHIRVIGFSFRFPNGTGGFCLYESSVVQPLIIWLQIAATGVENDMKADEAAEIPLTSGALCGTNEDVAGTSSSFTVLGGTAAITVTLVG
jgi:hypothetical protein